MIIHCKVCFSKNQTPVLNCTCYFKGIQTIVKLSMLFNGHQHISSDYFVVFILFYCV